MAFGLSGSSFTDKQRKNIPDWYIPKRNQLFSGESNNTIKEIKSYCTEG